MADPFSLVFDALWTMMDESPLITDLVKTGNRIKFNSETNRDVLKERVQAADLPEIVLTCEGSPVINMHQTSCSSMITRRYAWLISTGDIRINKLIHPVEWAIFVSMLDWKTRLSSLTWNEKTFVKVARLIDSSMGMSDSERNRGITGWSALWRCEVEMHFSTALLREELSSHGSS